MLDVGMARHVEVATFVKPYDLFLKLVRRVRHRPQPLGRLARSAALSLTPSHQLFPLCKVQGTQNERTIK